MTDCNETHENRPKIDLSLNSASVIISFPSGVIYENVAFGTFVLPKCEEGILAPLTDPYLLVGASAEVYYCPVEAKLRRLDWLRMTPARAAEIDDILHNEPTTRGLSVDMARFHESGEAWVYVNIEPSEAAFYSNFGSRKGVLVWANSD